MLVGNESLKPRCWQKHAWDNWGGGCALFALKLLAFATTIASIASKLLLPPLQLGHVLGCKCDVEVIASRHALLLCSDSL